MGKNAIDGNQSRRWLREITPEIQQAAWLLRDQMTPAEQVLWEALRDRRLNGLRFRRQYPVGQFILDFYCPQHKLVVELDGGIHEARLEQDTARTEHLNAFGYHVIRFQNAEVLTDLPSVLIKITNATYPGSL
ncbi:MAG: endonuclease domain-containing protein [Janthinobacterium lividum]